jgi:hypothetical protein
VETQRKIIRWNQFLIVLGLLLPALGTSALAQPTASTNASWAESVRAVHMSISISNTVVAAGATLFLTARITNESTYIITIIETGSLAGFDVYLTSDVGIVYKLTSSAHIRNHRARKLQLTPGQTHDWRIAATINKSIQPGEYLLEATRRFTLEDKEFVLPSDLLTVQVK